MKQTYRNNSKNVSSIINSIINKEDISSIRKDNSDINWTPSIEKHVIEIGQKSKGYKIMHIQEARRQSKIYNRLMNIGIVLGPISALISGIGSILNPNAPVLFPIISASVGFLSGIVMGYTKNGKFEENSSYHKASASGYTSLESNVRRQMDLRKENRIKAGKYLEYVGESFDSLFKASPFIRQDIYENYIKMAKNAKIAIPDEYELVINIEKSFSEELKNTNKKSYNQNNENSLEPEELPFKRTRAVLKYAHDNKQKSKRNYYNNKMKIQTSDPSSGRSSTSFSNDTKSDTKSDTDSTINSETKKAKLTRQYSTNHNLNDYNDSHMAYEIERLNNS